MMKIMTGMNEFIPFYICCFYSSESRIFKIGTSFLDYFAALI